MLFIICNNSIFDLFVLLICFKFIKEIVLSENALITSKTDLKRNIIYANNDFLKYAGYKVDELLYKSHNIARHEEIPKTVLNIYGIIFKKEMKFLHL
ncbi:hypothetical protein HpCK101_04600 [Helicobacter pylori]